MLLLPPFLERFIGKAQTFKRIVFWNTILILSSVMIASWSLTIVSTLFICLCLIVKFTTRLRMRQSALQAIAHHFNTLVIRRAQETNYDHYGNLNDRGWSAEKKYFLSSTLYPYLNKKGFVNPNPRSADDLIRLIDLKIPLTYIEKHESARTKGLDFERECAAMLTELGWNVTLTPHTRDQGADLICKGYTLTIVFQCKCHDNPVGNACVQQAHAAKTYWRTDLSGVISRSPYTSSARSLALQTQTILLHPIHLDSLTQLCKVNPRNLPIFFNRRNAPQSS